MASKTSKVIESHREGAEIYHGETLCKQKVEEILSRFHIPKGIMPLDNVTEMGYNPTTGFMWVINTKSFENCHKVLNKTTKYEKEVTALIEDRRMKKVTGIKSKEIMVCVPVSGLSVNDDSIDHPPQITFYTPLGLSKSFPAALFEAEP